MSKKVNLILLCCACYIAGSFAFMSAEHVDGNFLKMLGKYYEDEMLQLYGEMFIKMEETLIAAIRERELEILKGMEFPENATFFEHACTKMDCGTWTEWSDCSARPGYYGVSKRTRECGYNDTLCSFEADDVRTDTVSGVCNAPVYDMDCPSDFEFVDGFCLKLLGRVSGNMRTVTRMCQEDYQHSHLVNVNTPEKFIAVNNLLNKHAFFDTIYINGKRASRGGPYAVTYEGNLNYTNWASGEPSKGSSELCRVVEGSPRKMWDSDCNTSYYGVCEVSLRN